MIRLSKSKIGKEEISAVKKVLEKEYLGMGEEVGIFEKDLSKLFLRDSICVSSGTAAVQLAIQACNIGNGDEILVPSMTYVATFQAIKAAGAKPIACDIDENTCLIDLKDASSKISKRTKAIIPVHYTGGVGNLDELYSFASKHNLRVIEDAAHAFGTKYKDNLIGSIGDIVCFSFDGIKNITSGEGGCVVTSDSKVAENIKNARLLGVEKDSDNRYKNLRSWNFDVSNQGWRYHMSNIMAAIGIEQLKKFNKFANRRKQIASAYDKILSSNQNIIFLNRDYKNVVPHIYVVRIKDLNDRDGLREAMFKEGVEIGVHYTPNHFLNYFKSDNKIKLPVTEKVYKEIISLPIHPDVNNDDIEYVISTLEKLLPFYKGNAN
ncbi:MAG: DegT/DnrJ/EryC1/StrS family aminotransferase [Flavobacteriaceae bacterium]|jgi:dTDP-4-amino-4,6-dideoxygalactose transaminase|nr:DegT/DnrJ/EryC1/StrS family aminotransferase [Pelagibacteraceae bacterium]MBT7624269.1 DegT/DnrJ/EryC1/StrS family aminotransferase [Flavobacteriaceae bacterium]